MHQYDILIVKAHAEFSFTRMWQGERENSQYA